MICCFVKLSAKYTKLHNPPLTPCFSPTNKPAVFDNFNVFALPVPTNLPSKNASNIPLL